MSESLFDILDREADNSDSLEVDINIIIIASYDYWTILIGVCSLSFYCWWYWFRNGILPPGETRRQVKTSLQIVNALDPLS